MSDGEVFRTTIEMQSLDLRGPRQVLPETLVDTGSEFTWVPRKVLEELTLLGAHSLEGLNLKIDPVRKQLVPAGPVIPAAAA